MARESVSTAAGGATSARLVTRADKSFPTALEGSPITGFEVPLAEFSTPLLALDGDALTHNIGTMAHWARARGVELMPHGKTTMAPAIWRRQVEAGATGLSLATGWQAERAFDAGVRTVQIAGSCTDPRLLRRLAARLGESAERGGGELGGGETGGTEPGGAELVVWADDEATISQMEQALAGGPSARPGAPGAGAAGGPGAERVSVLVELGSQGGRTGAREVSQVVALAERVAASPVLELRGVAGYEGAVAHDRSAASLAAVREYCHRLAGAFEQVRPLVAGTPWVTAGGSAYFDIVAEVLAPLAGSRDEPGARVILRPGAYVVHDDGFYREISPLDPQRAGRAGAHLRPAMLGFARVVSVPEPGLALLDGGKRDFPCDEGLPVPLAIAADLGLPERPLRAVVTALNDQHAFVRFEQAEEIGIGDVVRLGLSHPCTAFDKWRLIPLIDRNRALAVSAIETFF